MDFGEYKAVHDHIALSKIYVFSAKKRGYTFRTIKKVEQVVRRELITPKFTYH